MMKRRTKRTISLLWVMLMVVSQSVCFAANNEAAPAAEYNPFTMTVEERLAWIEANVEAEYHSQAERLTRSETLYTTTKNTTATSGAWGNIGKLTTRVHFTCNDTFTAVDDWGTSTFTATVLISNTIKETNLTENRVSASQVKLLYEVYFTRPEGVYYIEHVYTLNGNGSYSIAVHNFTM